MKKVAQLTLTLLISMIFTGMSFGVDWLDPAWNHRIPITVNNYGGVALTDFQVHVILDGAFDFSQVRSDGSDLRFTTDSGITQLPFWIESWDPANWSASLWVKVPAIPAGGTNLFLYYGNQGAPRVSNGDSTFEFFDDFESTVSLGYYKLGSPQTVLVRDQSWEGFSPHTLSVLQLNSGGYKYWGYYGLSDGNGGVGLAFSNDLVNWTKYSSNPLFLNGRWPQVLQVGGTFYMLYDKDFAITSYIKLAISQDGVNFTDVKTIVQPQDGNQNQNPNLYYDTNSGKYYIYWFHGGDVPGIPGYGYEIRARSAATIEGLDKSDTETSVLQSSSLLAAPNMFFRDGTYFLSTEGYDSNGGWNVPIYSSSSPTSGFSQLPGNPVLKDDSACWFQFVFDNILHGYYCKVNSAGNWTLDHRSADLAAGRLEFPGVGGVVNSSKWPVSSGGSWIIVKDTQQDGTVGGVAKVTVVSDPPRMNVLLSSYQGTDYVLEAHGRLLGGRVFGIGTRVTDANNLYSTNIYDDLDSTNNLYEYNWANGSATTLGTTALGRVDPNVWYKLAVKVHSNSIDAYNNDLLKLQTSSAAHRSGGVALYGELGTVAEFNNVLVRKYAAVEPFANIWPVTSLSSLTLNPSSLPAGMSSLGTVVLSDPAPDGGVVVTLSSSNPSVASVPVSVTVLAGASSATFSIVTSAVTGSTPVTVSASYGGVTRTATLTVSPGAVLSSVGVSPSTVVGGNPSTGTVVLSGPAPSGGVVVTLSSSNTSVASVPGSVTVLAGATSATFPIATNAVTASSTSVTVSARYAGVTRTTTLTVRRWLSSVTVSPSTVVGGNPSTGTVTLYGPAPAGGVVVTLSSSNTSVASVPGSVTVLVGATSATFPIATSAVTGSTSVTVSARYAGVTRSTSLSVRH